MSTTPTQSETEAPAPTNPEATFVLGGIEVYVRQHGDRLIVTADSGTLVIVPRVSNSVFLSVKRDSP